MLKPSLIFHSILALRDRFESQIRDIILGVWVDSDRILTDERGYHIRVPAEYLKMFTFYTPYPISVIYFTVKFRIASVTHTHAVLSYQLLQMRLHLPATYSYFFTLHTECEQRYFPLNYINRNVISVMI